MVSARRGWRVSPTGAGVGSGIRRAPPPLPVTRRTRSVSAAGAWCTRPFRRGSVGRRGRGICRRALAQVASRQPMPAMPARRRGARRARFRALRCLRRRLADLLGDLGEGCREGRAHRVADALHVRLDVRILAAPPSTSKRPWPLRSGVGRPLGPRPSRRRRGKDSDGAVEPVSAAPSGIAEVPPASGPSPVCRASAARCCSKASLSLPVSALICCPASLHACRPSVMSHGYSLRRLRTTPGDRHLSLTGRWRRPWVFDRARRRGDATAARRPCQDRRRDRSRVGAVPQRRGVGGLR